MCLRMCVCVCVCLYVCMVALLVIRSRVCHIHCVCDWWFVYVRDCVIGSVIAL